MVGPAGPANVEVHAPAARISPVLPNYNPSSPCTIGMEWFPSADIFSWLDFEQNALAFALVADTDDVIENVWPMVGCWIGNQSVSLEVYDITSAPPPLPALSWLTFYPSTDRFVAPPLWTPGAWGSFNGWNPSAGGLGPMWAALDSPSLTPYTWPSGTPVDNNEFIFNYFGYGYDFAVGHAGTTGTHAGRWITRVRSHFVVAQYVGYGRPGGATITPYLWINGRKYLGAPYTFRAEQGPVDLYYDWYVNPSTGLPWTPADIDAFDDGYVGSTPMGLGFKANPTGSANNLSTILQAQLQVESAATDPRLAMAARTSPSGGGKGGTPCKQGWMRWQLRDTQTGALSTLPLTIGNKYLFVFRKATYGQNTSFGISTIYEPGSPEPLTRSLDTLGPPFWTQFIGPAGFGEGARRRNNVGRGVRLDGGSRRVIDLGIETGLTPGIVLQKAAAAVSKDSQVYASTSPLDGADPWPDLAEWFDNSPINASRSMQQEFTAVVTDDYGWLWIMCAQVAGSVDADLEIRVRRRSDDVQMGGTAVITSEDLAPPRHSWQRIGVRLPGVAPTLVAGTQYYLDITSAASAEQGWLVQAANSGYEPNPTGPPAGANAAAGWGQGIDKLTFGDTLMDRFGWNAPDAPGSVVALASISTVPDAPADFAAVAAGQTCCIDFIQLSWTPPVEVPCGGFTAYEVQRDDGDGVWRSIAYITDQAVSAFDDYESKANTPAFYRMRLIRGDGAPSDWTSTVSATAAMEGCCGLVFTSNESPDLTVFYQDLEEQRQFDFPSYEQTFAPHDRDFHLVFRELEDRGTTFKAKLRVRAGHLPCGPGCDDPTGLGVDVFGPVKAIARAGLSYVCVKNESGNRWFAFVRTPSGQWRQHGSERSGGFAAYTVDVEVVEVTDVPSTPDATGGGS